MVDPAIRDRTIRDLLDFEGADLYFDEASTPAVAVLLDKASAAENASLRAATLEKADGLAPDDLNVIVALYRFYYFQHDFETALDIADRAMQVAGRRLNIPGEWRHLQPEDVDRAGESAMPLLRFYLWALKGRGYLLMRLGRFDEAIEALVKIVGLDHANRLNCAPLLELAKEQVQEQEQLIVEGEKT